MASLDAGPHISPINLPGLPSLGRMKRHQKKSPPGAGFSNYRLSTGGGSRRQVPWLVPQV